MNEFDKNVSRLLSRKIDNKINIEFTVNRNGEYLKFDIKNGKVIINKNNSIIDCNSDNIKSEISTDYSIKYFKYINDLSDYLSLNTFNQESIIKEIIQLNEDFQNDSCTHNFMNKASIIKKDILIKFVKKSKSMRYIINSNLNDVYITNEGYGCIKNENYNNNITECIIKFIESITNSEYYIFYIKDYVDDDGCIIPTLIAAPYTKDSPYIYNENEILYPSTYFYHDNEFLINHESQN